MSLLETVQSVDVGADAHSLRDALAAADRLQAKLTVAIGAFAESGEWEIEGCGSVVAWLRENARMSLIPYLAPLDANAASIAMAHWRSRALDRLDRTKPDEPARAFYCSKSLGGRRELKGWVGPEPGERLDVALRLASRTRRRGRDPQPC